MAIDLEQRIRIDYIEHDLLLASAIQLGILRLDQIHPQISGNKWFKLKENIKAAQSGGFETLLTFGGAFSNHLIATAATAHQFGLQAIGIVRGFHAREQPSATLLECEALGMKLVYVSREDYNKKTEQDYLEQLQQQYPGTFIIPEGGSNNLGAEGAGAIAAYIPTDADWVVLPIGTGTTFCGIRNKLDEHIAMLGFPVMKGGEYLSEEISNRTSRGNWLLEASFHFGGFAKYTGELIRFMNDFYAKCSIPLDFVYTGKMMYGIFQMIHEGKIPAGSHIIGTHTGGLQGNRSISRLLAYS